MKSRERTRDAMENENNFVVYYLEDSTKSNAGPIHFFERIAGN